MGSQPSASPSSAHNATYDGTGGLYRRVPGAVNLAGRRDGPARLARARVSGQNGR